MQRIEGGDEPRVEREGICLNELKGVVRLGRDVNSDDIESGSAITHAGTARAAEEIKQSGARHMLPSQCVPGARRVLR